MAEKPALMEETSQDDSIPATPNRIELFVQLIGKHQYQVHRYVLSLVANPHDADDLVQDTNLFLWREFHRFQEGTSFVSWACSVAYHEVLAWRKKKSREKLVFSEQFLSAVSSELVTRQEVHEHRFHALAQCIDKLPDHYRELLQMRYSQKGSVDSIAAQLGRTTEAIYRMLSRIRHTLFECINRSIELETR